MTTDERIAELFFQLDTLVADHARRSAELTLIAGSIVTIAGQLAAAMSTTNTTTGAAQ